ncbi:OLC1v1011704C1 [Oldenlandia corymbosa var. corymbosa]|uniref:Pescadillo homolog n=1 Tax=Oldenlandia corymbosa var. corymbosa TaxID=529605 RepID=A0AAV1DUB7_OLDCO|nr:OLC1v1011704C1 [Oldenlandia corymbosa var. corymbosa]
MPKHYRPPGKKKEGNAAKYITRSQAVKYLQVSLSVFRKLCILKGVFPRDPKKKVKGSHHTYYHTKDIMFLKHEPLLEKLREMRAYEKKVEKANAKRNKAHAERLLSRKPSYKLDMLVRERYPTFVDALRDLDDCLSMVHLFASLPPSKRENIEVDRVHNCRRLSHEWQAYISRTHKLRKTFVSVKGIYYQAEVEGQKVTWVTPHELQQVLPDDVDYKVMLTFLEFYETLLAFVNFKLYHSINVKYPPILDSRLEALAADMYALSRYFDASSKASKMDVEDVEMSEAQLTENGDERAELEESELRLAQLQHQLPKNEPGALMHLLGEAEGNEEDDVDTIKCRNLFKNKKFFLSREVPRESLLFVIPAFGGTVSWEGEGAPFGESDQSITYQIVDRPTQKRKFLSREYVQPQWVYDSVNALILLPTEEYAVGRVPPPHLSPFVDNEAEGYVPEYAETIKRLQAAARKEVLPMPGVGTEDLVDSQNLLVEGIIDRAEAFEAAETQRKMNIRQTQYHNELRMELKGTQYSSIINASTQDTVERRDTEESPSDSIQTAKDADDMSKIGVSRRTRGLIEAMEIGNKKKRSRSEHLEKRRREIKAAQQS